MNAATLKTLVSWAVSLTGYPAPDALPELVYEPHAFFVEHACGGKECNVLGWYRDADVIYIDERYEHENGYFAASLVVHEAVHYLQDKSKRFSAGCEDSLAREIEAYMAQNNFLLKNGHYPVLQMVRGRCAKGADQ